ncbi:aldose 1-epimerase [Dyella sp. GSA-30]|uniref:aldose 1-epimerase n=1 Tax=Dyella sp. GSA-30 TaxID=2994496 RepID=UPI002491F6DC|nr:aldose 1-epimerase [Dyella sp. GSA-30]BDU20077.1 epimerase [Dyella sp. GSA-30]
MGEAVWECDALLRLINAQLSVQILPELGGGLAGFDWRARGQAIPLMRPAPEHPSDPNQLACYPLLPWSNRIADGGFSVEGRHVALAPNRDDEPFPIHGSGWQRAWEVREHSECEALLELQEAQADGYVYRATQRYTLHDEALVVELSVTNTGPSTMPFGLGLHPFFLRHGEVLLHAPASQVWMNDGKTPLPVARVDVPEAWDFHQPRVLPDEGVNHGFQPWMGDAVISWPTLGLQLHVETDVDTFVLYTPADDEFFCFEPVDHPINAVHLPGGAAANGMTYLVPGANLTRRFVFRVVDDSGRGRG